MVTWQLTFLYVFVTAVLAAPLGAAVTAWVLWSSAKNTAATKRKMDAAENAWLTKHRAVHAGAYGLAPPAVDTVVAAETTKPDLYQALAVAVPVAGHDDRPVDAVFRLSAGRPFVASGVLNGGRWRS